MPRILLNQSLASTRAVLNDVAVQSKTPLETRSKIIPDQRQPAAQPHDLAVKSVHGLHTFLKVPLVGGAFG